MVRFSTSSTNLHLVSFFSAQDVNSNTYLASVLRLTILILTDHVDPEGVLILMELPLVFLLKLGSDLVLVVGLGERDGLFGESAVLKQLPEVNLSTADDVVALEEVSIKHLHSESVGANYLFVKEEVFGVDEAIVPTSLLTWLQSVVSVSLQRVFAGVEEAAQEHITAVLHIHHLDVLAIED